MRRRVVARRYKFEEAVEYRFGRSMATSERASEKGQVFPGTLLPRIMVRVFNPERLYGCKLNGLSTKVSPRREPPSSLIPKFRESLPFPASFFPPSPLPPSYLSFSFYKGNHVTSSCVQSVGKISFNANNYTTRGNLI